MATTADDPVFVDTHVLVYANTVRSPLHIRAQLALQDRSASAIPLWISRQILREYLATLSRPRRFRRPWPLPHWLRTLSGSKRSFLSLRMDHWSRRTCLDY